MPGLGVTRTRCLSKVIDTSRGPKSMGALDANLEITRLTGQNGLSERTIGAK